MKRPIMTFLLAVTLMGTVFPLKSRADDAFAAPGETLKEIQRSGHRLHKKHQRSQAQQAQQANPSEQIVNTGNPNTSRLLPRFANNLPVLNEYDGEAGCYIACYAKEPGVYSVGEFGVHGLIRVKGSYPVTLYSNAEADRICHPDVGDVASSTIDISSVEEFKSLCNKSFPTCKEGCWSGGDTGGFFLRM